VYIVPKTREEIMKVSGICGEDQVSSSTISAATLPESVTIGTTPQNVGDPRVVIPLLADIFSQHETPNPERKRQRVQGKTEQTPQKDGHVNPC
jgi:hypothetical protein